jgi:hypothetical protein
MGGLLLRIIDVDELTTIFWRGVLAVIALLIYLLWVHGGRRLSLRGALRPIVLYALILRASDCRAARYLSPHDI